MEYHTLVCESTEGLNRAVDLPLPVIRAEAGRVRVYSGWNWAHFSCFCQQNSI
jgi:hypothetical protein